LACLIGGFVHVALPPYPFRMVAALPPVQGGEAARLWQIAGPALLVVPAGHGLAGSSGVLTSADLIGDAPASPEPVHRPEDWTAIFFTAGSTGGAKGVP